MPEPPDPVPPGPVPPEPPPDPDERSRRLAAESLAGGDPAGWFERLYAEAEAEADGARPGAVVPWDRHASQRLLVEWAERRRPPVGAAGAGTERGAALVVGCGYGMDAELVQRLGYATVAFDAAAGLAPVRVERIGVPGDRSWVWRAELHRPG